MITDVRQAIDYGDASVSPYPPAAVATWSAQVPAQPLQDWLERHGDEVKRELAATGVVLIRGFGAMSHDELCGISVSLTGDTFVYNERTTPRRHLGSHAFTATEYPADQEIFLHNENAYASQWPAFLYFYCEYPADTGGETSLADLKVVESGISADVRGLLQKRGLIHRRTFRRGLGLSWQEAFGVSSIEMLRAFCEQEGYRIVTDDPDHIVMDYSHLPLARSRIDGATRWFNHAAFFQPDGVDGRTRAAIEHLYGEKGFPNRILSGDAEVLDREIVSELRRAYSRAAVAHAWRRGDLLILDNMRHAHGRLPFKGSRSVWVVMSGQCFRRNCLPS